MNCLVLVAVAIAVLVLISILHSNGVRFGQQQADLKLESDLQLAKSRAKESPWASAWTPPKLPFSVIAAIWSNRFIDSTTHASPELQRQESLHRWMSWDYHREAPQIVAAAFLGLRDAGLVRLESTNELKVERTDLAFAGDMPAVEGGLLLACLDLGSKRFGKTTQPRVKAVVKEWIHQSMGHPYKWVRGVAIQQARELGLVEPAAKKRGLGRLFADSPPVYSIDHLAACEDQVVACVARWHEFGVSEPKLRVLLIMESADGISARQERSD
jgi:hypothetical protein